MATTVANLGQNSEFRGKFFRLLAEEGLSDEALHVSVNDRAARAQLVQFWNLLTGGSTATPNYQRVRDILGDDFISPQEVAEARGVTYTEAQLARFQETLPDKEILQWARDNDFMLVAGPPSEMNLMDIRELNPRLFKSKSGSWYADKREKFARKDTVGTNWLVLRKDPVLNSTSKTWSEQLELLSDNERVPNVAQPAWGFTTYAEVRGIRLIPSIYVRTSSVDSSDGCVGVGFFGGYGLVVGFGSGGGRYGRLGVASVLKILNLESLRT